jgi:antitoxin YefM
MTHVSYSDLRANLASYMEEVCNSHAPLLITRQDARSVIMVSQEDYEGLMETVHLLRSPANAARLLQSIKQAESGELSPNELIEPKSVSNAL